MNYPNIENLALIIVWSKNLYACLNSDKDLYNQVFATNYPIPTRKVGETMIKAEYLHLS
jgi:hypothetical protein